MSDYNDAEPFAAVGSGKSPEEIAYDLVAKLKGQGVWGEKNMAAILDMYAECLDATRGLRAYEGQKRIEVPVNIGTQKQAAPAQVHAAQPVQPAQQAAPAQAQPQNQQQQPHQAQAVLNQAFHRG